jgi:hypothetical protein
MRTTSKLALAMALALAAMALAAGPASAAATVAEFGDFAATENEPFTISNSQISISCDISHMTGTVTNAGALTFETFTITGGCTETISGTECTMVPRDWPITATITHNPMGPHTGDVTWDAVQPGGVFAGFDITCAAGTRQCTASTSSALTAELTNSDPVNGAPGQLEITGEVLALSGTLCGSSATLNAAWTIDSTANGTDTTITVTA